MDMRRIIVLVVLGLGLVLAGCGSSSQGDRDAGAPAPNAGSEGSQDSAVQDTEPGGSESARQVIVAGDLRVITNDPAAAADVVAEHGESRGGYVESRDDGLVQDGEAVVDITLRVPADEFEQLMTDVGDIGEVVQRSQSAEDVTGAVRDLDSRIRALEVSTERLESIMAEADTSSDLLEAEAALSERQGELEELVAQRDDLDDQVSMATLQVELRQSDRPDDSDGFAGWFAQVGTTLVNSAGGLVVVLAALLPWVVVIGIPAYLLTRWLIRRRKTRSSDRRPQGAAVRGVPNTVGRAGTDAPGPHEDAPRAADAEEGTPGVQEGTPDGEEDSRGSGARP